MANLLNGFPIVSVITSVWAAVQICVGVFFIARAREFVAPIRDYLKQTRNEGPLAGTRLVEASSSQATRAEEGRIGEGSTTTTATTANTATTVNTANTANTANMANTDSSANAADTDSSANAASTANRMIQRNEVR